MPVETLRQFHDESWQRLEAAVVERDHPCRLIQLATHSASGPQLRTVVLREVDRDQACWLCHTDARSAKVREIEAEPRVAVLAYDGRVGLQLRGAGTATLEREKSVCAEAWSTLSVSARRLYLAAANQEQTDPGDELDGVANLMLLRIRLQMLDLLLLHPDGHRRARYRADQGWRGAWIRP